MTPRAIARPTLLVLLVLSALTALAARPAAAGTAYVPLSANLEIEGVDYQTVIWLSNAGATPARFATRFVLTASDGTPDSGAAPQPVTLIPGGTYFVGPLAPEGTLGLVEVTADPGMVVKARLIGTPPGGGASLGSDVPVVTSDNLVAAQETATLQGIERDAVRRRSSLGVLNLGPATASCSIAVHRANNQKIGSTSVIAVPAYGQRQIYDALGVLGEVAVKHVRADVRCDQPFFAYAAIHDVATGEVAFVAPSSAPDLTSTPTPGGGGGGGGGEAGCPAGAVCYDAVGLVHRPTPAVPVGRVTFNAPSGTARRLRLQMDVQVGAWFPGEPDGKHLIYWFVVDNNKDMPGMLYLRGPNENSAVARHGINLTHPQKGRLRQPFAGQPGKTYHVDNDYDMGGHRYTVTITDKATGQLVAQLAGVPNVSSYTFRSGAKILVDMGFRQGAVDGEVPSYGWEHRNVHVEVYP